MKKQFLSKSVPKGTRTIWRYLGALFILFTFAIGNVMAADPVENVGTYSTQVISADGTTSTWTFITPGSQVTIPTSPAETEDNDIIFHPGGGSKMKFSSSNGFSWSGNSDGYIYVPAGAAGSISMTVKSASDSRWLQLYVGGEDQGSTKRLWSKEANPATDARGPRTFTFTSSDLTTKGTKTYLHLKDNNTELKIATITVTLTTGTYGSTTPDETAPTLSSSVPANSATDVAIEGTIVLTFSEAIASVDGTKFSLDGATIGTVAKDGSDATKVNVPYSGAENEAAVTLSVAAEAVADAAGNKSAELSDISFTTVAAVTPACPSGISISGTAEYNEGQTISLEAALEAGNGEISYKWYKGAILAENEVGTGATFTKANCTTADQGEYFCVASKEGCGNAASTAYAVTVEALVACAELYPATSGASPTAANQEIILQTEAPNASFGGKIYTHSAKSGDFAASFTYTANGIQLNKGGDDKMRVELTHLMQVGTTITVTLVNLDASKARGFKLCNASGTAKATWQETTTDPYQKTYTVVAGDGLAGSNIFILQRAESSALKELKVSNCGAELLDLSSAVTPDHDPAYATVTLSATKVVAGGSATATYSIADPTAWDFDGWEITSGDATIADATAAEATVTMGSTAATITLKLKAAGVKHTVTYRDENDVNLGEELVNEGQHPVGLSIAPRKLGYTFAGWGTSKAGPAVAFSDVTVNDDMSLYTIWNEIDCSAQNGTIYTMSITVAPAANCTIKTAEGYSATWDLYQYEGITGGEATLGNTDGSNDCILQTNKTVLLKGNPAFLKLDFDCPLKEGDKIRSNISGNTAWVSTNATRPSAAGDALAVLPSSSTGEFVIPAASDLIDAQTIYIWKGGGNTTITSINVYRPAHFAVTFNMHDHGDAVDPQSVVEGGKVTKPTDPTASGWDFGGWFTDDTYGTYWDFENMTISSATEIHALWTVHTTSSDATLKDLTVNGVTVAGFDPATEEYYVVLEMGTTTVAEVSGTANDDNVKSVVIMQTDDPTDDATITVTAEDNTTKVYTVHFSVATSKDIELVWDKSKKRCDDTTPAANVKSDDASVSAYINKITFTGGGAEGSSLNVGNTAGNMFTLSAKAGYAFQALSFFGKIQDATCEYSLNGGAWTELASTKTDGDKCYANVFSAAEVHEFRLRSTGAEGVWIRNMQLTLIEACTPVAITWDEEPVEFEVGKAGYAIAATANNSGTITYGSTDASIVAVDAGNGVLSIGDHGSATLSASTAEGDGSTYCANGGDPIVLSKVVNTYYLVKFDGQNGEAAGEVKYFSGDAAIALPAAPSYPGYDFQGWFDAETGGNKYTAAITPAASMTVYAQWVAQCDGATINTQPTGASYLTGRTPVALVCEATAGAGGALTYEWFTCDDALKTNPVAATAMPSTAVAGTFYYFCKVMEEGCDVEAYSDVVTITVADKDPIYLTWVDVTANNTVAVDALKSLYAPEVSASNVKNTSTYGGKTGYKFNSDPAYIAIEGAPFKAGDIVEMFVTNTTADKARVFNANEAIAANVVAEGAANMVQGANKVALTTDANNLYLRRGNDFGGWNPSIAYVAVYRACAPILNKMTVAGVDGTPDNTNHVAIEVPASTADAALDAIVYNWVSNNDAWTAAHAPAVANTWEWGVENTVTLTDKDGDASEYYITISKAAASSDATLSALTVNGQAIALEDGVYAYNFELPYGTTVAPTVVATPNHIAAVATVDPCTLSGATITVVPESGEDNKQVYTLTFVISKWKEVVIWDGSTMSAVKTAQPADIASWEVKVKDSRFKVTDYTGASYGEKGYSKTIGTGGTAGSDRYFKVEIPAGYVAKLYIVFGAHADDASGRGLFVSDAITSTAVDGIFNMSSTSRNNLTGGYSEIFAGNSIESTTCYINPTTSVDIYEVRAYLRPGMVRTEMLGNGVLGTVCVDHNVAVEDIQGVTVYELVGREPQYGKVAFDEIVSGELEAGAPYLFQAHGDRMVLFFGDTKVDDPVDKGNGMYGTFEQIVLTDLTDVYYFAQRALWSCDGAVDLTIPANRAYVKLSEIGYISDPNPAPGRRRITMVVNGEQVATGIDELNASDKPVKMIINGQLFIIRGEKMYDAKGQLVK